MMAGEAASEICGSIAQEVRTLRREGSGASPALSAMIEMLCHAPAPTFIDVLALAAISRKMLSTSVGEFQPADMEHMDNNRLTAAVALIFLERAVTALEFQTGVSAEGFTGEVDTLN